MGKQHRGCRVCGVMKFYTTDTENLKAFYMQFIRYDGPVPENIIRLFKNDLLRLRQKNEKVSRD